MSAFTSSAITVISGTKNFIGLGAFYLVIFELTLLIFGFSFNFGLFSQQQALCRKRLNACLETYTITGISDKNKCNKKCMGKLFITIGDFHKYNPFVEFIENYVNGA